MEDGESEDDLNNVSAHIYCNILPCKLMYAAELELLKKKWNLYKHPHSLPSEISWLV